MRTIYTDYVVINGDVYLALAPIVKPIGAIKVDDIVKDSYTTKALSFMLLQDEGMLRDTFFQIVKEKLGRWTFLDWDRIEYFQSGELLIPFRHDDKIKWGPPDESIPIVMWNEELIEYIKKLENMDKDKTKKVEKIYIPFDKGRVGIEFVETKIVTEKNPDGTFTAMFTDDTMARLFRKAVSWWKEGFRLYKAVMSILPAKGVSPILAKTRLINDLRALYADHELVECDCSSFEDFLASGPRALDYAITSMIIIEGKNGYLFTGLALVDDDMLKAVFNWFYARKDSKLPLFLPPNEYLQRAEDIIKDHFPSKDRSYPTVIKGMEFGEVKDKYEKMMERLGTLNAYSLRKIKKKV